MAHNIRKTGPKWLLEAERVLGVGCGTFIGRKGSKRGRNAGKKSSESTRDWGKPTFVVVKKNCHTGDYRI